MTLQGACRVHIIAGLIITLLLTDDVAANEGHLQFSIPRINAIPGKGQYRRSLRCPVSFSLCQLVHQQTQAYVGCRIH